jgi:hypothetical protein
MSRRGRVSILTINQTAESGDSDVEDRQRRSFIVKLFRPFRIASLSRAEALRAESHGGISPGHAVTVRTTANCQALHFQPGKVEIMLMTGLK